MKNSSVNLKIVLLSLVAVLITASIGFTAYYFVKYSAFAGNKEVIDFKDLTKEEIDQYLIDNSIKPEYVVFEEEYSEEVEEGKVISQSILPGEGKFKDVVTITISKGYDPELEVELPDITDMMNTDIMEWFEENHFSDVTYEFVVLELGIGDETETPYGKVLSISKIGSAKRNEKLTVTLADMAEEIDEKDEKPNSTSDKEDKKDELVTLIDFKGFSIEEFGKWAHDHGLKYWVYEVYSDDVKKGEVISQSPAIGAQVKKGTTITMKMSLGQSIKMPNFVGKTLEEAESWAKENKLKVTSDSAYSRTVAKGKIISQSVAANKEVAENDSFKVTVSLGTDLLETIGTSYVGKSESDLLNHLKTLGSVTTSKSTSQYYNDNVSAGNVASHDSEVIVGKTFSYAISKGPYSLKASDFEGKTVNEGNNIIANANNLKAGVSAKFNAGSSTFNSSEANILSGCSVSGKTVTCTYKTLANKNTTREVSDLNSVFNKNTPAGSYTFAETSDTKAITVTVKVVTDSAYGGVEGDIKSITSSTGSTMSSNTIITITKYRGPEPTIEFDPSNCKLKEDSNNDPEKTKSALYNYLTGLGFTNVTVELTSDYAYKGRIDFQSSTPNTAGNYTAGTAFRYYVGNPD